MITEKYCLILIKDKYEFDILNKDIKFKYSNYSTYLKNTKIRIMNTETKWIIFNEGHEL